MNDDVYWVQIVASLLFPLVLLAVLIGGISYLDGLGLEQERLQQEQDHPDWPWALIDEGGIKLGMTDEMVRASWGAPSDINQSVGSWGIHEQWVYSQYPHDNNYLYFENGILTSWQT